MKKANSYKNLSLSLYLILYFIIFLVLPFILLQPKFLVKDIAWFIDYFTFLFPLTFFMLFWILKKNNKKIILWLWVFFLGIYLLLIFYEYNMVITIFRNSSFPF